MPQRKDTPAARAALARRRQRAAQTLRNPPSGGIEAKIAAVTTTATQLAAPPSRSLPPPPQANNTIGHYNNNLQPPPMDTQAFVEPTTRLPPQQQINVRTEKQNGLSSTPSTVGEMNIEAVLQESPEIYQRISNFGSVKITAPQPIVHDRMGGLTTTTTTKRLSPKAAAPAAPAIPRNMPTPTPPQENNLLLGKSQGLQLPSLQASAPKTAKSTKPASTTAIPKPRVSRFANAGRTASPKRSTSKPTNPKYVRATSPTQRVSRIPSPTTTINPDANKLLPRRNASPKRTSPEKKVSPQRFRLPVTTNKNTTTTKNSSSSKPAFPKPQRPSARNATTSRFGTAATREKSKLRLRQPESASPDRQPTTKNRPVSPRSKSISPYRQFPPVSPSSNKTANNDSNKPSHKMEEDLSAYLHDSCSIAETSLIPDAEPHLRDKDPIAVQSQSLGQLSPRLSPRDGIRTNVIQLSPHLSPSTRTNIIQLSPHLSPQQGHPPMDAATQSPFVIRQRSPPRTHRVEEYRADENDAKRWNVRAPLQTTQKFDLSSSNKPNGNIAPGRRDSQVIDAACLHSGELVMLRSCSSNTALQKVKDEILASFDGPCLGKDEEMLRIVKVNQGSSSPLMYGDVVIVQAVSTQRALGARRRRNNVNGKDELGFFEEGDKDYSRWVVRSAASDTSIVVGRAALVGEHQEIPLPIRSGNSIALLNCYNGGLLTIRGGVATLLTDSYDPNRMGFSNNPSLLGRLGSNDRLEPSVSETFQLLRLSIPPCPTWITPRGMGERVFLTGSYLSEPFRNPKEPIIVDRNLRLKGKENILVDEVIGSFLGLEGLYIKLREGKEYSTIGNLQTFHLCDGDGITFDLSLRNLVEQILPLSTSYVCVRDFIGLHYPGYEYGRVMQAFCEGLDVFLQQFVSFVAQLEHKVRNPPPTGALTMKNIHFEITPLLHSMAILENTTKTVFDKKGGALINALRSLEKRVYMGDTVAKDLLGTLLDRASVPYAETLSIWLQSGRLHDPYEEFMVQKTHHAKNGVELDGDTWAELFTFNEEHVIQDIVRNEKIKNRILVTGKYWNAVQACIVDNMSSDETRPRKLELKKLQFQSDLSGISSYINTMYESASGKLMHILRDQFHLRESLQIMKRYFLLDQGDFLVNFLEATGEELSKPVEEVSIGRVQHFLGNSVQFTESQRNFDVFPIDYGIGKRRKLSPTNLRCRLSEQSLVSYLDSLYGGIDDLRPNTPSRQKYGSQKQGTAGFDFFEIDFSRVPFPISLIISPTSMEHYKLLFRHLFFAKHVERRLVGVWSDHQVLKKLDALRGLLGPTFLLRQRMQHCVQNLMNYMSFEVVESNWLEMLSSIDVSDDAMSNQKEQTVDDLLNIHDGFLQKTMDSCLLTNPDLIKSLIKLLNTCLLFTDQMKRFMDTTKIHDDQYNVAAEKRRAVQRNLNERVPSLSRSPDKKKLRKSMLLVKEERDILLQRQTRRVGREICSESYKRMIGRFEEVFSADLAVFMRQLNGHTSSGGIVTNLGIRLDWNGYVSNKMSSTAA